MSTQTEQEQIEELKNFWTEYGKPIFIGVLLAITAVALWKFWENRQIVKKQTDAQNYQVLVFEAGEPTDKINVTNITTLANQLQESSPDSYYAQYAKFFVAKLAVDNNALDDAAKTLQTVLDKPADLVIAELARQRLAKVLAAQGKTEEAVKLLDVPVEKAFTASRNELKGDLLLKLNRLDDARTAYQAALAIDKEVKSSNQLIIKMKLDDLAKEGA